MVMSAGRQTSASPPSGAPLPAVAPSRRGRRTGSVWGSRTVRVPSRHCSRARLGTRADAPEPDLGCICGSGLRDEVAELPVYG
jgi:hypothetical protein